MKTTIKTLIAATLALSLGAAAVQAATRGPDVKEGSAKVVALQGPSTVQGLGEQPRVIEKGMIIPAGSLIITGQRSQVVIDLGDNGQLVSIKPGTRLAIDRLQIRRQGNGFTADTQLEVTKGSILGNVVKLPAGSNYKVRTPRGNAGIRGTIYTASATMIQCAAGLVEVEVTRPDGQVVTFEVPARTFIQLTGAAPQKGNLAPADIVSLLADGHNMMNHLENLKVGFNASNVKTHVTASKLSESDEGSGSGGDSAATQMFKQMGGQTQSFSVALQNQINSQSSAGGPSFASAGGGVATMASEVSRRTVVEDLQSAPRFLAGVGGEGFVRGQLLWNNSADLDLQLMLAGGTFVDYNNANVVFNGTGNTGVAQLDLDNLGDIINQQPDVRAENVIVNPALGSAGLPSGTYQFFAHLFSDNGNGPTTATLLFTGNNSQTIQSETFTLANNQQSQPFSVVLP